MGWDGQVFPYLFHTAPWTIGPMPHSHPHPRFPLPGQREVVVVAYPSARRRADFPRKRRSRGAGFARCFAAVEGHIPDNCVSYSLPCRDKLSWPEKEQMSLSASPLRPSQRGCGCPNVPLLPWDPVAILEGPLVLGWVPQRWVWKSSVRVGGVSPEPRLLREALRPKPEILGGLILLPVIYGVRVPARKPVGSFHPLPENSKDVSAP